MSSKRERYRIPWSGEVLVKYRDEVLPWDASDEQLAAFDDSRARHLSEFCARHGEARPERAVPPRAFDVPADLVRRVGAEARRNDPGYARDAPSLFAWVRYSFASPRLARRFAAFKRRQPNVERAYLTPAPAPDPADRSAEQTYRAVATSGVGASALANPHLLGAKVGFADVERGWQSSVANGVRALTHVDHTGRAVTDEGGDADDHHGTCVIGIVLAAAEPTPEGVVGVAPAAILKGLYSSNKGGLASAVLKAAGALSYGDVLLIEAQVYGKANLMPAEADTQVFQAIRAATAKGVVVVAAAGNGGRDLASSAASDGGYYFERSFGTFRDSGAILVAAGERVDGAWRRKRESGTITTNYGARVDCFAPGVKILTTFPDDTYGGFSDTSAASAVIAGVALAVQGMAVQAGPPLTPLQVRHLLRTYGTGGEWGLGIMPDLVQLQSRLGGLCDIYVRDSEIDAGSAHPGEGRTFQSPDIYLPGQIDPNGATVAPGTVRVHVRNRGVSSATTPTVSLYASAPSSYVVGGALVHTATPAAIPAEGSALVDVPGVPEGAHALLVVVHDTQDPAPDISALSAFPAFFNYVQCTNNLAWRCSGVKAGEQGVWGVPCLVRGPPEGASMRVEVRVSAGAAFDVELPEELAADLGVNDPNGAEIRTVKVPASAGDWTFIGEGTLATPAGQDGQALRVVVRGVERGLVEIRQLHRGVEIGRFCWTLT